LPVWHLLAFFSGACNGHRETRRQRKDGKVSLDSAARHILEECRMVLPGIQGLFGFQLIAVFNDGFGRKLTEAQQYIHFAALILVSIAIALVMAPAAIHRQTSQREVSERFIWRASQLLLASMLPLAIGLCLDLYLVGSVIVEMPNLAAVAAALIFATFLWFWAVLPHWERRQISGTEPPA